MPLLSLIFLLNPIAGIASWIWVALRNIDRTSWTALRGLALLPVSLPWICQYDKRTLR